MADICRLRNTRDSRGSAPRATSRRTKRETRRSSTVRRLSFREQLDAESALFFLRNSKGRLVSLSVMADNELSDDTPPFLAFSHSILPILAPPPFIQSFLFTAYEFPFYSDVPRDKTLETRRASSIFALVESRSSETIYNARRDESVPASSPLPSIFTAIAP